MPRTIAALGLALLFMASQAITEACLAGEGFTWPNGARAAVCLTYDDGLDMHLDNAVPDLDAVNLKGSFYVTGNSSSLARRMDDWRAVVRNGHEIGNHTCFHPCNRHRDNGDVFEWVTPEQNLENYNIPRIVSELQVANTLLYALDGKKERTLAYTCYDHTVADGQDFIDQIKPFFLAARAGHPFGGEIVEDMQTVDLYLVPGFEVVSNTAEELIDFVNQAVKAGTMAVITFHGVGTTGDRYADLNIERQEHRKLLAYLAKNRDKIWTDTFIKVMKHVIAERKRLGWDK
ncbi:MAG TPA: polysaccharide deacetylase family protein [archaeon]|nr:polysaccharide deacetylase family protein [archaeon]